LSAAASLKRSVRAEGPFCSGCQCSHFRLERDEPLQLPSGTQAITAHLLDLRSRNHLLEQDMFDADVSNARLVFIYSTYFGPLIALGDKLARELPRHALVSTTSWPLRHSAFGLVQQFDSLSIAYTTVFLYVCVGALNDQPAASATQLSETDDVDGHKALGRNSNASRQTLPPVGLRRACPEEKIIVRLVAEERGFLKGLGSPEAPIAAITKVAPCRGIRREFFSRAVHALPPPPVGAASGPSKNQSARAESASYIR
jgi:hypothetical protein